MGNLILQIIWLTFISCKLDAQMSHSFAMSN